ncbi:MAG: peptidoglycan-binding domain-containing protein [Prochlorothrix sp.]|nr:peptidoglycan-binding domain-containing protein [Prochlorothrix sp.]
MRSSLTTSEVSELQEQLADLGYFEATATGYYGTITEEAVRRFQADRGLVVDGVAGPATFEALVAKREQDLVASEPISPSPVVSEPAIPVNVDSVTADLQSDLASLGYYQGRVDGIYGPLTSSAIEAFKEDSGLPVNGLVSVDMLEALDQAITSQVSTVRLSDSTISVTPMYSTSTVSTSTSAELVSFVSRDTPSPSADTKQSTDKVIPKPADEIVVRQGSGSGSVVVQQRPERTIIEAVPSTSVFVTPPAETVLPGTTYATYPPAIPFGSTYSAPYSSGTESIYSTPDYDSTGATAYGYGGPTAPPAPPRYDASFYPYVVAIPYRSQEDLATVARFSPSAFVAGSQRGTYVNAGSYASRVEAESLTEALRQQGLDARVIFRPR